jgi:tetratricopeptide (TPR) repeat protein
MINTPLRPKICRLSLVLTVLAVLLGAAGVEADWIRLPDVDVSSLEPAVANQLERFREITEREISDPESGPDEIAASVGELGRNYHAYELIDPAEECYRIARRLTPEDFRWHYYLGFLLQGAGRLEEAEGAYLRALELYRAAPPALLRLAEVYVGLNRMESAASLMREALALTPESLAAKAALGELYQRMGRTEEAIELLEAALEERPGANRLYYPLALAYRALGETDEARRLLGLSGRVGIRPMDPMIDGLNALKAGERVHLLEGQAAFRVGRYAEAAEAFRRAVEAAPDSIAARIDLGSALGQMGRIEEAVAELDTALDLAPGNVAALFNAGILRAKLGDIDSARQHLRNAAQLEPDDAGIRLRLADVHWMLRELDDALLHYRAAAALAPPGEVPCVGEAQVLSSLGRYGDARDRLEECLVAIPTSGLLAHALSRLLSMGPNLEVRDGARAIGLALRVYEAAPSAAHAEVVAAAHAEMGECQEAVSWQRRALESSPDEAAVSRRQQLERYEAGAPCQYPVPAAR